MSKELHTLNDTDTLFDARKLMSDKKIRHVPIINNKGCFVGILSQRDILASTVSILADVSTQEIAEMEYSIPIKEVMTTDPFMMNEEGDLMDAAKHLITYKHGCVPIVQDGKLKGIVTDTDFVGLAMNLMEQLEEYAPVEH